MQLRIVFFSLGLCLWTTKAFDMVSLPKLFKVLLEMGIPKHLVALVADSEGAMGRRRVQRSLHQQPSLR